MDIFTIPSLIEVQIGYYVRLIKATTVDEVDTYDEPVEFRFEYVYKDVNTMFPTQGLKTTMNQTQLIRTSSNDLPFKVDDVILVPGPVPRCKISGFTNFPGGGWKISSVQDEFMEERVVSQWPFSTQELVSQNSKKLIKLG